MYQVAIITSAPADGLTLVDVSQFETEGQVVAHMNVMAKAWAEDVKAQNGGYFKYDEESLPHNYDDPTQLDMGHTWLWASDREHEFMAAVRRL